MKTTPSRRLQQRASTLLTAIVITGILSLSAAGYLALVQQQNFLSARSQAWNIAIAIVEAGIEEALQQLNSNSNDLSGDGWSHDGSVYSRTRTLSDGNSYTVTIDVKSNPAQPAIVSRAFVLTPKMARARASVFFAAAGASAQPVTVSRAVRVTCSKGAMFTAAMVARRSIDLKGNGVMTDSFDSSNPAKSTNGRYAPAKYSGDKGDVATNGGIYDSVGVQNANIYGYLRTGPGCPVSVGPNGGVGTHAWQAANGGGFQPGYVLQDANFTFPDTTLPNTAGYLTPLAGDIVTTTYSVGSVSTNSTVYPTPPPAGGVTTNSATVTTPTLPNPVPAGVVTNAVTTTVTTLPSPIPTGIITNTTSESEKDYPEPGTYVGTPVKQGSKWRYDRITGYSYSTHTYTYFTFTYAFTLAVTNATYTTNHYDAILHGNTKYVVNSLAGKKALVYGPNVTLVLPNGADGTENLTWNAGASICVYAGGASFSLTGNNIVNPNGFAGSLVVFCAPSVTSIKFAGNGEFTGVLVAPEADLELKGGGNSAQDFCGSLMVNNVRLNGHYKFHYDEALENMNLGGRYLISSWDEIP